MDYAIVIDPDRPHYGECGPVEQCHEFFWWIPWGPTPNDGEAYFIEEIYVFSVNSPSITA
jgi:hypothetical protein